MRTYSEKVVMENATGWNWTTRCYESVDGKYVIHEKRGVTKDKNSALACAQKEYDKFVTAFHPERSRPGKN